MDRISVQSDPLNGEFENMDTDLNSKIDIGVYKSENSKGFNNCLPIPFERASKTSWWDPKFDSDVLEEQFKISSSPHAQIKLRYALWFILLVSSTWFLYYIVCGIAVKDVYYGSVVYECSLLVLTIICVTGCISVSYTKIYDRHILNISMLMAILLAIFSLVFLCIIQLNKPLPHGYYAVCLQVLILLYTLLPLRMYVCTAIGIFYSIMFEILTSFIIGMDSSTFMISNDEVALGFDNNTNPLFNTPLNKQHNFQMIFIKALTHLATHIIGLHIFLMSNVRMRNTFMKVGFSLLVRRQLELEKKLKENMIYSLIPKSVVDKLKQDNENSSNFGRRRSSQDTGNDFKTIFRPFSMSSKDNVSILFADICGFTKMSSNKTAEELVDILNDLFQRFDLLCKQNNCEKISTLGDCYYCISGCPDDNEQHAKNCVEMGLRMVQAIKQYDDEKNQGIKMRVGIHTGKVLFGIVGTRRFKFDVWSNDVTLANRMESTGRPGMVHISQKTLEYLEDMYLTEEGEPYMGLKTFFILGRKVIRSPSYTGSFRTGQSGDANPLHLVVTNTTNVSFPLESQVRPRVLTYDTSTNYNTQTNNPNLLSPNTCKIKANSLPSILDSENEQNQGVLLNSLHINSIESKDHQIDAIHGVKSPCGKSGAKLKNWRLSRLIKKNGENKLEMEPDVGDCGYKQVPTIFESNTVNGNDIALSMPEGSVLDDDTIDMKSYISQSRSDMIGVFEFNPTVADFIRGGSYRSQCGRTPYCDFSHLHRANSSRSRRGRSPSQFDTNFEPTERTRSATVVLATGNFNFNRSFQKRSLDVSNKFQNIPPPDDGSVSNSRKDSGIKSSSRRSSLQQLDSTFNSDIHQNRVSGYYTSSHSSINSPLDNPNLPSKRPHLQTFVNQNLRKQSDRQLIKCVQDNSQSSTNYFLKPPLFRFSLFFRDSNLELDYRQNVHSLESEETDETLSNSKINTYLDVFISTVIFILVSIELFAMYGLTPCWIISILILLILHLTGSFLCLNNVDRVSCLSNFFRWNLYGTILITLPILLALINFIYNKSESYDGIHYYSYILFISLVHFCNFTQVNSWVKNFVAITVCFIFAVFILNNSIVSNMSYKSKPTLSNFTKINTTSDIRPSEIQFRNKKHLTIENMEDVLDLEYLNETLYVEDSPPVILDNVIFKTREIRNVQIYNSEDFLDRYFFYFKLDLIINLFLLLVLVIFLNREFEIGYRLSFHANYVSKRDQCNVQMLKDQADYLIYNIVPQHVAEKLKKHAKYSENFKDVGIIFASVVNFNEMYDESFADGIEYLRILNELIADFDELLDREEFESVEKIKTIGSTYMAASGLNSEFRNKQIDQHQHLYDLMEFALQMQEVVKNFNTNLLQFELKLRIGYNIGDVTAAVIGNTKLYYDIWGDSVNIASRMDTTGVDERIQVGERCLKFLDKKYEFVDRGSIYVKGKDNMNCYLLKRRKSKNYLQIPET